MGPTQDPPEHHTNQAGKHQRAKEHARRPRLRRCLLKGCECRYRPSRPWSRYCGDDCRQKARKWSRWKAQKKYRSTGPGKKQRKAQCRRYRERVRTRKRSKSATHERARVIRAKFFRVHLRPPRLLRLVHANASFSPAAILFEGVPTRIGACPGAGTALEGATGAGAVRFTPLCDDLFAMMECAA
jgi:hypothetical protein